MKVMISQPMYGKTEEQIKKERQAIIDDLTWRGYEVIDTIFAEDAPEGTDPGLYFLAKSIEAMSQADGIVFMSGWDKARGCIIEHEVAVKYNKFILELN